MTTKMRSVALALAAFALAPAAARAATWSPGAAYAPGEVLVKFKPRVGPRAASAAAAARGHALLKSLGPGAPKHVRVAPGESVSAAVAAYRGDPDVEYAQPNYLYRIAAVPNDPAYGQLWGFKNGGQTITTGSYPTNNPGRTGSDARVERAWNAVTDCSPVTVAVIDSGVNHAHEDLAANMWDGGIAFPHHGFDFVDGDDDPADPNGHGTHVAGTIGAVGDNGLGVVGVCWKASVMAVRVMGTDGSGSTATIIQGIQFAVTHGAKVINMSLGGVGPFDPAFSDALLAAHQADVVVVVAAGNEALDLNATPSYPCAFPHTNLICVAALDQAYALASFSNHGSVSVDVGAPGTNIHSAWSGTETILFDPLSGGWTRSSTTGTGWALSVLQTTTGPVNVLADPGSFPSGLYANATDDRIYKTFDLRGADVALLHFASIARMVSGDLVVVRCSLTGSDPFAGAGVDIAFADGLFADGEGVTFDMTGCAGGFASLGFQLLSDTFASDLGIAIGLLAIQTQRFDTTSYNTIDGTSMAAPLVAGVATLLRARNPLYTAADVVSAITASGVPVTALAGRSTTGKAVDAAATLAHIQPAAGLTVTVE